MSESSKTTGKNADLLRVSTLLTATAIWSFANGAAAQDATSSQASESAETIEEVVVTGFRASLNKALDAKQNQVGSIDMIVAEDIADFPDLNLAESLQRVPGVVIARDAGEGRQISVRGLGPQFTRVRINGLEAMSANGSTDASGGTNRTRSFDFNTFASELFNNITVRKTASAEIEEGSLGATVDLQTGRPFDYDGLTIAGSVQAGYNDLTEDSDPRAAFLISNTFADGKFGALLSLAYTDRKLEDDGSSTVRWQPNTGIGTLDPAYPIATAGKPTLAQIRAAFVPRIPRYDEYKHDQQRLGVTAALQFAPSDATSFSLDALYAKFDAKRDEIFLEAPAFSTGGADTTDINTVDAEIDANNSLVYGVFNDVDVRSEARHDELTTKFTQVTLEGKHTFSDAFNMRGQVGFAEANHDNPVQTTLLFDALNIDGYSYDYRANSRLPLITYGTTDVANPATWTLTQIRLRPQSTINSYQTASLDFEWSASDAFKLKFGPQWKNYLFKSTELRRSNGTTANIEGLRPVTAPIANYSFLTHFGSGLSMPAGSVTTWLTPDLIAAVDALDLNNSSLYPMGIQPVLGNNNQVEEDDQGAYVQGDFKFELGAHSLRGNVGVRYVKTDMTSEGYVLVAGVPVLQEATNDYSDVLPSLNLVYDLSESLLLRFGASKVMTRPNLGQLTPGASVSVSGNNRTVSVGNPTLDPFRAKSYDLGVEWYFAPESLLSVAFFYKDVESFVQTLRDQRTFTGNPYGLDDSVAVAACGATAGCNPGALWDFTIPATTEGGPVKGFEVSYQQPFTFLPGVWSNFGTILNYTGVESEITYLTVSGPAGQPPVITAVTDDLTGLSKRAYNATLYFDNKTFSARVSAAFRSDYLTTVPGRNSNDVEGTAETLNIDFSSSYNINDHFTVSLEALNLTDEVQDQWVGSAADRLSYYHHQGTQYYLGARFKY
ncbi:MAG TPA: TonB-dependent receptor [Steroidobacteraceae bacterium]|jgi:TonB-dependent receptor|nr:TonB-dependent receptor [Steroidobacteraceae bacterium]